jgi:hypothetical protein
MLPDTGGMPMPAAHAQAATAPAGAPWRISTSIAATEATCTAAAGIRTQPRPSRSTSRPCAGAEAASPTATSAVVMPAIAYEPVT